MQEIEPIAGFRGWNARAGHLYSINGFPWQPGESVVAKCQGMPLEAHEAPGDHCLCGINAYYRFGDCVREFGPDRVQRPAVLGIIRAEGQTVLSERGFRSERATLEALIAQWTDIEIYGQEVSVKAPLEALAKRYGVPLIEPEEIEAFCITEGLALQEDLTDAPGEIDPTAPPTGYIAATNATNPRAAWNPHITSAAHAHAYGHALGFVHTNPPEPRFRRFLKALAVWRSTWPL